jgi:glycosyltransferase involved in cell wall biosynthesis
MLLRSAARRLAFDFDDAVCFRDSSRGATKSPVRMRRFRRIVRAADIVTAGNPYLAGLAVAEQDRRSGDAGRGADRVVVAPTPIDAARFCPGGERAPHGAFHVGWIGSRSTRRYLSVVARPLADLVRRVPQTVIAVMADQTPSELAGLPVEFTPWSEDAEVPFLRSLDAGIMPLPDDPWTRGKCGFKLLQYMACGVASVASDVGANREILGGGASGVLCGDDDAWTDALVRLSDDAATARDLGLRGRAAVESHWSAAVLGPQFAARLAVAAGASAQ